MPEELTINRQEFPVYKFKAGGRFPELDLDEVWEHRELIGFLAWRDLASRYRVPALAVAWALIQPTVTALSLSIFLGRIIKSVGVPYPLMAYTGLLAWQYLSSVATQAASAPANFRTFLSKVYFPRLIMPLSMVVAPVVDFAIASIALVALLIYYHAPTSQNLVFLPIFAVLGVATAVAAALWISALSIRYYDARHVIPLTIQVWLLCSPVYYASLPIAEEHRIFYFLNPAAGLIMGFRWCLWGYGPFPLAQVMVSMASAFVLVVSGLFFFKMMSRQFADVI